MRVAPCDAKAARYAVEHWHYSKRLPTPPLVHYGVWEHDRFIGAVIFGRGGSPQLHKQFALDQTELCELVRVALTSHEAPVSQIVTEAIQLLKVQNPGLRLIVSFADPYQGHVGKIYQAMGWLYMGTSNESLVYRDGAGRLHHSRVVSKTGLKRQYGELKRVPKTSDLEKVKMPGKHRYVKALDKSMLRKLRSRALTYPAVEGSTVSHGTPGAEVQVRPLPTALGVS